MAMVGRDNSQLVWCNDRQMLDTVLRSSNEPDELSQWLCYIINIVLIFTAIIIIIIINMTTDEM